MTLTRDASIYFHSKIYAFSIACYRGPSKQSTHLKYMVQGQTTTILAILYICSSTKMGLRFCV